MITGPPNFSAPVVMSRACNRCTKFVADPETSLVTATTYRVPLAGSITGVPVIPDSVGMSEGQQSPVSLGVIVVMPADGLIKLTFHSGAGPEPSASKAYTLSCSVAT